MEPYVIAIRKRIREIEEQYAHVLEGELSNIQINAPRALLQLQAESKLEELYGLLGEKYVSKLVKK